MTRENHSNFMSGTKLRGNPTGRGLYLYLYLTKKIHKKRNAFSFPSRRRRTRSLERKRKKGREIRRESRKKVSRTNAPPPPPPCIAWLQAFLRACYVRGEMWSPNRRKRRRRAFQCAESPFFLPPFHFIVHPSSALLFSPLIRAEDGSGIFFRRRWEISSGGEKEENTRTG